MPKELTTAELFGQAGMQVPTPADLPALSKALETARGTNTIRIEYSAATPVATSSMLAVAHRLLLENFDLSSVVIYRLGTGDAITVRITIERDAAGKLKETFYAGQVANSSAAS